MAQFLIHFLKQLHLDNYDRGSYNKILVYNRPMHVLHIHWESTYYSLSPIEFPFLSKFCRWGCWSSRCVVWQITKTSAHLVDNYFPILLMRQQNVSLLFCGKGTFGWTKWPFWPHSANWPEVGLATLNHHKLFCHDCINFQFHVECNIKLWISFSIDCIHFINTAQNDRLWVGRL